jgi:hypothetical protein
MNEDYMRKAFADHITLIRRCGVRGRGQDLTDVGGHIIRLRSAFYRWDRPEMIELLTFLTHRVADDLVDSPVTDDEIWAERRATPGSFLARRHAFDNEYHGGLAALTAMIISMRMLLFSSPQGCEPTC